MKSLFVALGALVLTSAAPAVEQLPVHVGGRVIEAEDASLRFGWPGIYFEGRFRGTAVTVEADSATEHMRLLVDGEGKAVLIEPGKARLTIAGLSPGNHVVRLEKLTESQSGGGRFLGFFVEGEALPPMPRERRIEFIGDSYTVGYGNMAHGRACTPDEVHDLTNTQRAFGPLVAKRLDAEYRIHAFSGFGIVRNYNGGQPALSLPIIYPRAIPGEAGAAADGAWSPQLIVVNLGTNDFSTELDPGERWASEAELRADYRQRYGAFLGGLMRRHPEARIILMGSKEFIGEVEQVAAALAPAERRRVTTLAFGGLELDGCDWHPSLADHEKLADQLVQAVAGMDLGWK